MKMAGSLSSPEQLTPPRQKQLENAVAYTLGVPPALVDLLSFKDGRRRLMALSLTFQILATNAANAAALQSKASGADFASAIKAQTGADVTVSEVLASIAEISEAPPTQDGSNSNAVVVAAAVATVGGVLLLLAAVLAMYFYRHRRDKTSKGGAKQSDPVSTSTDDQPPVTGLFVMERVHDVHVDVRDNGGGVSYGDLVCLSVCLFIGCCVHHMPVPSFRNDACT
jgi:hypothetical protein